MLKGLNNSDKFKYWIEKQARQSKPDFQNPFMFKALVFGPTPKFIDIASVNISNDTIIAYSAGKFNIIEPNGRCAYHFLASSNKVLNPIVSELSTYIFRGLYKNERYGALKALD